MQQENYVIGVDFGTDSVRSIIVNTKNGEEISSAVHYYSRWKKGMYCNPESNQFRQHPLDYLEGLEQSIQKALEPCPGNIRSAVRGISVDTTGSTPVAVNREGTPLSLLDEFSEDPDAMFILWKDHTAIAEADEINHMARNWGGEDYTKYSGGVYSSEWFWSKILHILRVNKKVGENAYSWVEHCDWIPAILTGNTDPLELKRSRCAAGHKALWHPSWDGLPPESFLVKIDPLLKGLREKLYTETYTSDIKAGVLTPEWAGKLGLGNNVMVGVGAFDAHMGAVGGEVKPYTLSKVVGTSTCDMVIAPLKEMGDTLVGGICGQVDGSIVPGMLGLEAGQSAFGDIYAWFKNVLLWPLKRMNAAKLNMSEETYEALTDRMDQVLIEEITEAAAQLPIDTDNTVALDWMNGRRTPWANQALKGALAGLSLGTDAPRIFKSLVEATAFGSKLIMDRFIDEGVRIDEIIALGGVAKKSGFVMQCLADIMNKPIKVAKSEQAVALGAAMFAAVTAGVYDTVEAAQQQMGAGFEKEYIPVPENAEKYAILYEKYKKLGKFVEKEL